MGINAVMRKFFLWLVKAAGAGMLALVILSFINIFYSYTGVHITNTTGATDYVWEPYQLRTTMQEGFSWLHVNNEGFNNSFDYHGEVDILLMGSSHMEAMNVAADENTGYLLNQYLPDMATYNIGISGHTIYRCVDNVKIAVDYYNPEDYLIIEADSVKLDVVQMQEVILEEAERIPSYESGVFYHIQKKIPAVKWLYKQLKDWINLENEEGFTESDTNEEDLAESEINIDLPIEYHETINNFLKKVKDAVEDIDCHVIIFYHPHMVLKQDGKLIDATNSQYMEAFKSACDENGITFINMADEFQELYNEKHILSHGFFNTAVGSGHLNRYGHEIIARSLSEIILKYEKGEE